MDDNVQPAGTCQKRKRKKKLVFTDTADPKDSSSQDSDYDTCMRNIVRGLRKGVSRSPIIGDTRERTYKITSQGNETFITSQTVAHNAERGSNDPICLKKWWKDSQEMCSMQQINNVFSDENNVHRATMLRFLAKAEQFRNEFGDSAVPIYIRIRVRRHEHVTGINESKRTKHEIRCDRERVHDPRRPGRRCNKEKKEYEHFEDCTNTWIAPSDSKPCHCFRCKS